MADATTQMIDAAERIVAESGFAAMTVSAVQQAAGQGNKSAVQYHFGDRDGLIRAVLDARMAPANERRMSMLERLDPDCSLRDLVEVRDYSVRELQGEEKERWWARANEVWPSYDEYQSNTERVIPVFLLEPV